MIKKRMTRTGRARKERKNKKNKVKSKRKRLRRIKRKSIRKIRYKPKSRSIANLITNKIMKTKATLLVLITMVMTRILSKTR